MSFTPQYFNDPSDIEDARSRYMPGYLVPRIHMPSQIDEELFLKSAAAKRTIKVVALEGTHGVGKTTMLNVLDLLGFHVIREEFMNIFSNFFLPNNKPHNCLVEIAWASQQVINIINMASAIRRELIVKPSAFDVFFVDRTFLTGYAYGVMTDSMKMHYLDLFSNAITTLKDDYNIEFYAVRFKPPSLDVLFKHIQSRLIKDKSTSDIRKTLNEADRTHMETISECYDKLEEDGFFKFVYNSVYNTLPDGNIVLPMDKFFESIGLDDIAKSYKDFTVEYNPKCNLIDGLAASLPK